MLTIRVKAPEAAHVVFGRQGAGVVGPGRQESSRAGGEEQIEVFANAVSRNRLSVRIGNSFGP
jgi:hypothetical protein